MRHTDVKTTRRSDVKTTTRHPAAGRARTETGTLLALTLACYILATACVLTIGYALTTLAARDVGRQAAAVVAPHGL
jgi:hypothetical protein